MRILHIAACAIVAAATMSQSYADADNSLSSNIMKARPSEVRLYGTLAPKGSFEEKAAPTYSHLADYRDHLADLIYDGKITVNQAQAGQHRADLVRDLLDNSFRACAQNNKTGKCTGDQAKADKLFAQAKQQLAQLTRK